VIQWFFTISRALLAPISFFSVKSKSSILTLTLIGYAIISDFLDGYFARRLNQVSNFGALADAFADKIFINFTALSFCIHICDSKYLKTILGIWFIRDIILFIFSLISKKTFISLYSGKVYTAIQFAFIFIIAINLILKLNLEKFIFTMCFVFSLVSLVNIKHYYRSFFS